MSCRPPDNIRPESDVKFEKTDYISWIEDEMKKRAIRFLAFGGMVISALSLSACNAPAKKVADVAQQVQPFKPDAGIKDIMAEMIDPSADFLWESVKTDVTAGRSVEKRPTTPAEWAEVRRRAITLAESANLLMVDGRRVAKEGERLDDHGVSGNLSASESEAKITANRAEFIAFAQALHASGQAFVKAADARDSKAMVDAGDTMDQVCESCHLRFWYPGQKIPAFPDDSSAQLKRTQLH